MVKRQFVLIFNAGSKSFPRNLTTAITLELREMVNSNTASFPFDKSKHPSRSSTIEIEFLLSGEYTIRRIALLCTEPKSFPEMVYGPYGFKYTLDMMNSSEWLFRKQNTNRMEKFHSVNECTAFLIRFAERGLPFEN